MWNFTRCDFFSPFIYFFPLGVLSVLSFMYLFNAYIWVKDEKGFKHKNNKCNTDLNCCCSPPPPKNQKFFV